MGDTASSHQASNCIVDPISHLPLPLLGSELTPPAPTPTEPPGSSIDWLPNFAGYSWVAYGASSLLAISHFPSPLSVEETKIGPIFRQVLELPGDESSIVNAVSWSPAFPSKGELAAASGNSIWVFSHDSENSRGSFCWRQNAVLLQSREVEAIKWTGTGDGIVAGGVEVVLWRKSNRFWEIAWKFKTDQPQTLVSASWYVEGPSATASFPRKLCTEGSLISNSNKCVLVCQDVGKSEYVKTELHHPLPVSMIQWRPTSGKPSNADAKHVTKHVLLTCCLDGTVRLWSEMDNGKARKHIKDTNDQKLMKMCFSVVAVIEINQSLNGTLGVDVHVTWASEIGSFLRTGGGADQVISTEGFEHHEASRCEWLIGFGAEMLVTFWAIRYLDNLSPLRYPRVTLWKKQQLDGFGEGFHRSRFSDANNIILLNKVVISRNHLSGPPIMCSLIQLLPCNSMIWSSLYAQTSTHTEEALHSTSRSENFLSGLYTGYLNLNGHAGSVLQIAVHPRICEVELAASLDSNGLLLFWSLSSTSKCVQGLATLIPAWKLNGKLVMRDSCSKYTSLQWAPSILDGELILLIGHARGIDCFVVWTSQNEEENIECHYLCTVPFTGHGPFETGPTHIFSIPLPSRCNETKKYTKFLLLGIWMKEFKAISWDFTLTCYDLSGGRCDYNVGSESGGECNMWRFGSTFGSKQYDIGVIPCSSQLPDPHIHDEVTCFDVVCEGTMTGIQQKTACTYDDCSNYPAYVMATGCSDGSLKLWRSNLGRPSTPVVPWELVGMFVAHQGPISALCLTDCGGKIATTCMESQVNNISSVHIWESVHIADEGMFVLEDTLSLKSDVVSLSWLTLGNGKLLLGVCLKNELYVYTQRCCGNKTLLKSGQNLKLEIWICIGFAHTSRFIHDFIWGPKATAVIVHDSYFCVINPWLFLVDKENKSDDNVLSRFFTDTDIHDLKISSNQNGGGECMSRPLDRKSDYPFCSLYLTSAQMKFGFASRFGLISMLDMVEKVGGSLPAYHPEALLINIYSGKWKRAYVSLRHLVEYLNSDNISEKRYGSVKSTHTVPHILLSDYFEGLVLKNSVDEGLGWSGHATLVTSSSQFHRSLFQLTSNLDSETSFNTSVSSSSSSDSEIRGYSESIEKFYELAGLTSLEKAQILAIIDLLGEITNQHAASTYESLDEPGRRYWIEWRFQQLLFLRQFGRSAPLEELVVDSGMIGWAYHSDCQEILFSSLLPNEPSWQEMRSLGVGFWFTNTAHLRTRMEKLARSEYLKKKDPKDCALFYIMLNRLQVLVGLFKISRDEKDKPLVGFLSRNFQEEKNKAAAVKNAYVLMGRHQLELAIAFFLLGGDASSAISVCAKNLQDQQLALVICRLVEGSGGPLERYLITKIMLPSAIEKGDFWLASLLEWELGNYSQSFLNMFGFQNNTTIMASSLSTKHISFFDPRIGIYCLTLATKSSMRSAVGEQYAASLCKWATLMTASALNRCGLPIEALECLSSYPSILGVADQVSASNTQHSEVQLKIPIPSPKDSTNWLSAKLVIHLEYCMKLDMAVHYLSNLLWEHPSWPNTTLGSDGRSACLKEYDIDKYEESLKSFHHKLCTGIAQFQQKFSLLPFSLVSTILVSVCNQGMPFVGNDICDVFISQDLFVNERHKSDNFISCPLLHKSLLKAAKETSLAVSRYIAACSVTCSEDNRIKSIDVWWYYLQGLLLSLSNLRATLRIKLGSFTKDLSLKLLRVIDLVEYSVYFASAWLQRNSKALLLALQPLLITLTNAHTPYEVDVADLRRLFPQITDLMANDFLSDADRDRQVTESSENVQVGDSMHSILRDESSLIIGSCLWSHISRFMEHMLHMTSEEPEDGYSVGEISTQSLGFANLKPDCQNIMIEQIRSVLLSFISLLKTTLTQICSCHTKQLSLSMLHKLDRGLHGASDLWMERSCQSHPRDHYHHIPEDIVNLDKMSSLDYNKLLWNISADPNLLLECFARENIDLLHKTSRRWVDIYKDHIRVHEAEETNSHEGGPSSSSPGSEAGSLGRGLFLNSWLKDTTLKEVIPFQNLKEIYKRNGELLEALCINSIDQQQIALASNRKGIVFFNWEDGTPSRRKMDYIWSEADWPQNGWAGSESTPAPTCVSPGVGLGRRKGAHLGLGGATVGVGSLARPGRDLIGGGAFGVPGYAGIGASGLGWETHEDFEELEDPPATAEKISTRAFSSHPSKPFFLVGSSNTHIYLWEFGKEKAIATYGVLPAANVPPPYALASISSLDFDHCGQRFASAALDGTVCTWQLEVGGRSNIRPTESSLCFNGHASDVTYVTSSGSIIAVAGYSSTNVNVVIWDTLAPPSSSQASIMCHEGGARSVSVFDNDIGSGSISPLIVTGGKGGDIGLHDFRYVATGRTKKLKHSDNKVGEQNLSGMLWYVPKAHSGSVTKIAAIPNTSLFLTGSKDGDVKLWDAKRALLVHHWSKLHDRHTFLQPSSRGFGGVVRAAVTDIQVVSHGFLTCGGDGSVKMVQLK